MCLYGITGNKTVWPIIRLLYVCVLAGWNPLLWSVKVSWEVSDKQAGCSRTCLFGDQYCQNCSSCIIIIFPYNVMCLMGGECGCTVISDLWRLRLNFVAMLTTQFLSVLIAVNTYPTLHQYVTNPREVDYVANQTEETYEVCSQ